MNPATYSDSLACDYATHACRFQVQRTQVIDEPLSTIASIHVGHVIRYRTGSSFLGMRMTDGRNARR